MTDEQALAFMNDLNELCKKHRVWITNAGQFTLSIQPSQDSGYTEYLGIMHRSGDVGNITFSVPWPG
jgi:hypothetical protein